MQLKGKPFIDIVLAGNPNNPSLEFIEVEYSDGRSIGLGTMIRREDGFWVIRFNREDIHQYLGGS